mgnify:CR=1 FL=1
MDHPYLYRLDGRPIPDFPASVVKEMCEKARRIYRRTGCSSWYSTMSKCVTYCPGEKPIGGPCQDLVLQNGRYIPIEVDEAVKRIMMSVNASMEHKERAAKRRTDKRKALADEKMAKARDDMMSEFPSLYKFNRRVSQNKHSKRVFHVEHTVPKQE